jgi:hypothetical protein
VRFADGSKAPWNYLDVAYAVRPELISHTQIEDRWNQQCMLIAGRTIDEKVVIPLEMEIAQKLFARPGKQLENFDALEKLWEDHVAAHLPAGP